MLFYLVESESSRTLFCKVRARVQHLIDGHLLSGLSVNWCDHKDRAFTESSFPRHSAPPQTGARGLRL